MDSAGKSRRAPRTPPCATGRRCGWLGRRLGAVFGGVALSSKAGQDRRTPCAPPPGFSQVFILKGVKVFCFDTLLQVFILKVLTATGFVDLPNRLTSSKAKLTSDAWENRRARFGKRALQEQKSG